MATPKGTSTLGNENGDEDTTQMGTPKGPLNLGSIWIRQLGEGSKSLEIIEPKNEAMQTPTRRITRSIIVLSDSKSKPDASPVIRDSGNGTQEVKNTSQWSKNCKRQMDSVAADLSSRKKKVVPHEIPQVSVIMAGNVLLYWKSPCIQQYQL